MLGNVLNGLSTIMEAPVTRALRKHNVDTNRLCRHCTLRYLCGGGCRVWGGAQGDLDSPAADCGGLHGRARSLLDCALAHLHISSEAWLAAGLPLPDHAPVVERVQEAMSLYRILF